MKLIWKTVLTVMVLMICSNLSAQNSDNVWQFNLSAPVAEKDAPPVKVLSDLMLKNNISLRAKMVGVDDAAEVGHTYRTPKEMMLDVALQPDHARQLTAYYVGLGGREGWYIVPTGWRPVRAAAGVDGSVSVVFGAPAGQKGFLSFYSAGACAGCAMVNASLLFPEVRQTARDDYGQAYGDSRPKIAQVHLLRPHVKTWRTVPLDGQVIDGVSYYNTDADLPYFTVSATLPPPQRALAREMLNWAMSSFPTE